MPDPSAATCGCRKGRNSDLDARCKGVGTGVIEVREDHRFRSLAGLFGVVEQGRVEVEYEERADCRDAQAGFAAVEIHVKREAGEALVEADRLFEPIVFGKHSGEHAVRGSPSPSGTALPLAGRYRCATSHVICPRGSFTGTPDQRHERTQGPRGGRHLPPLETD